MSRKQIIPLIIALGLLVAVLVFKQTSRIEPTIEGRMELEQMAPKGFLSSDVTRLEIYRGGKEEEKVSLVAKDKQWRLESRYNAPGNRKKINEFLGKLKDLEGEYRSDGTGILDDYKLSDEESLHVAAFRNNEKAPSYHLLVGKSDTYRGRFVRRAGENAVYTVNVNLASEMGVWGEDTEKVPESQTWLDKTVIDLEKDDITYVSLVTPNRTVAFEKREKKVEKKEGDAEKPGDSEAKKEYEWVVAEGGKGLDFNKNSTNRLLSSLDSINASDVEDPADREKLGLDKPAFRCTIRLAGGTEKVLLGSRETPDSDGYLMVDGRDTIYKIASYTFKGIFKAGKDFFKFKGLQEPEKQVKHIALTYGNTRLELEKEGEEDDWKLSSPDMGLEFKASAGTDIAKALSKWTPADYADGAKMETFGLEAPENIIEFTMESGKTHTIRLGAQSEKTGGRYALLDDNEQVWIAGDSDLEKMLPELKDLFESEVARVPHTKIRKVKVDRQKDSFVLEKKKKEWTLTSGRLKLPPDTKKIEKFVKKFSPVTVADLAPGRDDLLKETWARIYVDAGKHNRIDLQFGAVSDGKRAARVAGKTPIYLFTEYTAESLAPPLKDLADLTVSNIEVRDMEALNVQRQEDPVTLKKEGEDWKLSSLARELENDSTKVNMFLSRFSRLKAEDIIVDTSGLFESSDTTVITVTDKDGTVLTLTVGEEKDGKVALRRNNDPYAFLLRKDRIAKLTPPSQELVKEAVEIPTETPITINLDAAKKK